jgi:hypothetical protein
VRNTRGNADVYQSKGLAEKAICKCMKMMEIKIDVGRQTGGRDLQNYENKRLMNSIATEAQKQDRENLQR